MDVDAAQSAGSDGGGAHGGDQAQVSADAVASGALDHKDANGGADGEHSSEGQSSSSSDAPMFVLNTDSTPHADQVAAERQMPSSDASALLQLDEDDSALHAGISLGGGFGGAGNAPLPHVPVTLNIYNLEAYSFGVKPAQINLPPRTGGGAPFGMRLEYRQSPQYALKKRQRYEERGTRRSVAAALFVHEHFFPHILLLRERAALAGVPAYFLPGGRLRPGETDADGVSRKLESALGHGVAGSHSETGSAGSSWEVGPQMSVWYGPDFSNNLYPYIAPHVDTPREELHVYAVYLPSSRTFVVPKHLELIAVPLFDIFQQPARYGAIIASLPVSLSNLHMNLI
ncbi:Pre-mRNA cleavage factor Im 25 kDa subunit 2 [Porphyridium purpureum]|uniref:Pre-mRNA cleavage factor Im 25 kDa subunit 2 n=1 Tax=Porphyridium purpureum TaxID=35688 RepID=A0A5J4Z888_PORPP|nr:Pre-mRNA cleavage factor Im 25 kDa subunit 2 [Porphyridium purpureum]|eukprot:POR4004..scf295_1